MLYVEHFTFVKNKKHEGYPRNFDYKSQDILPQLIAVENIFLSPCFLKAARRQRRARGIRTPHLDERRR